MKAARCAPTLCGGKPNDLAAGTASYRLNFLAARLDGTENPTKRPPIRRMSAKITGIQGTLDLPECPCSGAHPMATLPTSAPVRPCARHLLAVDVAAAASGGAKLVKLGIERLPIGADAGVANEMFFDISFSHILRQA